MSIKTVDQLIQNFREILPQVDNQTRLETNLDGTVARDWLEMAQATRKAAQHVAKEQGQLEHFELALRYRIHQIDNEPIAQLEEPLFQQFSKGIPPEFAAKQIHHLCTHYSSFAQKLLRHEELAANFFKFCLQAPSISSHRDKPATHWVDIFIKYPDVAERLMKSSLYEKLGRFPENMIIDEEKGVCLTMDLWNQVSLVSITLTKQNLATDLYLRNRKTSDAPLKLTLEKLFEQFENSVPDLDVSMNGIINLNSYLLGSKSSKGTLDLIDSPQWTSHKPYVKLDLHELRKLYPGQVKNDPPYGFVLRSAAKGQPFFDFVVRKDAKYRVISLHGPQEAQAALNQHKMVFYPLDKEQGETIIRKVAEDIEKYRISSKDEKPAPYIDVQPYIDEVLGKTFYTLIQESYLLLFEKMSKAEQLAKKEESLHLLAYIKTNLNPGVFEQFMRPVIDKLVKDRNTEKIHHLITTSLATIYTVLQKEASLPSHEEVYQAFIKLVENQPDKISQSLLALTRLCFDVLHPYRLTIAESEKDTPILGHIFRTVEAIPWEWLKILLTNSLLVLLGPFRGYHYPPMESPHQKSLPHLIRTVLHMKPENYLSRSSQLIQSCSKERIGKVEVQINGQLAALTTR